MARLERFVAAVVGAPFGVSGHCKIHSHSGEIEHLLDLGEVFLRSGGQERRYEVEDASASGGGLLMKFRGIETPEAAKRLAGAEILVDRKAAAPLSKDEYYIEDLRGLPLLFRGTELAKVTDVLEGGGAELLEVLLPSGEHRLIPFRKEFIGKVDLAKGSVELLEDWILE